MCTNVYSGPTNVYSGTAPRTPIPLYTFVGPLYTFVHIPAPRTAAPAAVPAATPTNVYSGIGGDTGAVFVHIRRAVFVFHCIRVYIYKMFLLCIYIDSRDIIYYIHVYIYICRYYEHYGLHVCIHIYITFMYTYM